MPGDAAAPRREAPAAAPPYRSPSVGEVLDRGGRPGDALEVARPGLEPVGAGPDLVGRQRLEDLAPPVQRAERAARRTCTAEQARKSVSSAWTSIGQVRRVCDGVDIGPGAGRVGAPDDLGDGVDRAERVRRLAEGHEPGRRREDRSRSSRSRVHVVVVDVDGPDR